MSRPYHLSLFLVLVSWTIEARAVEAVVAVTGDDLAIHLSADTAVITAGRSPTITITLINHGTQTASLVLPGDGSDVGWRTPIIGWAVKSADDPTPYPQDVPLDTHPRCGNMNALEASEIFSVAPGQSVALGGWTERPWLKTPGKYRMRFYYHNNPSHGWNGGDLGHASASAMQAMHASTPCFIISDELAITVIAKPDAQTETHPLPAQVVK